MNYRSFGNTKFQPSALGFGAMRLPLTSENSSDIDEVKTQEMIEYAVENGINYFDTAYVYHKGQSEVVLGKILKNGLRDKIKLATKLPPWKIQTKLDFDKVFEEQLQRLQTDHIDYYLLHNINEDSWNSLYQLEVFSWAEKQIASGKIGSLGFSTHQEFPFFKKVIDAYDKWAFCLIQYNFVDENIQVGKEGLKYAAGKGLGVVIMEPLKGGRLASAPSSVQKIWDKAKIKRTPPEWALSWLWNQPEVSLVLSGMSTLEQVKENIKSADKAKAGMLTQEELILFEEVKKDYQNLFPIPCTGCKYCLPCPKGVNIPRIFDIYNNVFAFQNLEIEKKAYQFLSPEEKAENCIACGKCESLCPQKIKIIEELKKSNLMLNFNE